MSDRARTTRERLLTVASGLFHRKGFAATSFDEIVDASGIRRGNIYYYYKTKDEILDAVVERRIAEARETIDCWRREIVDPRARLERFVEMVFGRAPELAEFGCPIGTLTSELGKGGGRRQAIARRHLDVYRDFALVEMRALGFSPARARDEVAELLARCQGAALLAQAYGDRRLLERRIAAVRTWLRQLRPEGKGERAAQRRAAKKTAPSLT